MTNVASTERVTYGAPPREVHVEPERESVSALVGRLVDDVRNLVTAEIALQRTKLSERIAGYKSAVVFFAIAGVLVLAALVALLVGLIMTLATLIGPGLATLAVVIAVLVIAGVLGMIGKSKLTAIGKPELTS